MSYLLAVPQGLFSNGIAGGHTGGFGGNGRGLGGCAHFVISFVNTAQILMLNKNVLMVQGDTFSNGIADGHVVGLGAPLPINTKSVKVAKSAN